ncbi:hypothetical protein BJX68DRAFT_271384 [Aspergillus pseudodeflectus]|uniref:Uncharacterized protein n=1 Tax=Aspergillus pseudodeflectus TaxID=176178 RepID=A0ABR4JLK4_9EURO
MTERNEILQAYKAEIENKLGSCEDAPPQPYKGPRWPAPPRPRYLGGTQIIAQLPGVNATPYYIPTVVSQSVGLGKKPARLLAAANFVHYISLSYLGMRLIDNWGRRAMLIRRSGSCVCYFLLMLLI